MDKNEIIAKALNKKGQFASIEYKRICKVKKGAPNIYKVTQAQNVRIGAQYDAMQAVKDARADGTLPAENQGLNGLQWVQYPVILQSIKSGAEMLRIETAKNSTFKTQYYVQSGNELQAVTKDKIQDYLYASEKSNGEMPIVLNIKLENITVLK